MASVGSPNALLADHPGRHRRRELAGLGLDVCDLAQVNGHSSCTFLGSDGVRAGCYCVYAREASDLGRLACGLVVASAAVRLDGLRGRGAGAPIRAGSASRRRPRRPASRATPTSEPGAERRHERVLSRGDDLRRARGRRAPRRCRARSRSRLRVRERRRGGGSSRASSRRPSSRSRPSPRRRTCCRPSGSSTARRRPRRPCCGRPRSSRRCSSATSPDPCPRPISTNPGSSRP